MVITEATGFPSLPSWTSVRTIFHPLPAEDELKSHSEAASKRVRSAGASCREGRSQAAHPARSLPDPLGGPH